MSFWGNSSSSGTIARRSRVGLGVGRARVFWSLEPGPEMDEFCDLRKRLRELDGELIDVLHRLVEMSVDRVTVDWRR